MVKSGQRQHQTVKSRLNWLRESILVIASLVLWSYCMVVVIVLISSLFPVSIHEVQIIRAVLNVERKDIIMLFQGAAIVAVMITLFLSFAYAISLKRRRTSL